MRYNPRILQLGGMEDVERELERIGCDSAGAAIMKFKALCRVIKMEKVNAKAANILKQAMLSKGGDAAVNRRVADFSAEYSDVLLMGTLSQLRTVMDQLYQQPWGLPDIVRELRVLLESDAAKERVYQWGERKLEIGKKTLIMGILNVTPDSFSDGGCFNTIDAAMYQACKMVEYGADIIDIGGESTRPYGHNRPIEPAEEMERVLPVLERLVRELPVPISLDTYKSVTARAALKLGVHMINDIWGLQKDPAMAAEIAAAGVPVVVMHNKSEPGYQDLLGEITGFLRESIRIAEEKGIDRANIIVDPGIGFGKTAADNVRILRCLREMEALGCPILVGTSRKAFIGAALSLPPSERMEGTAATVALGISNGAAIVRVHDVKAMARVARMTDLLVRKEVE